ncbi:protein-tyrosine phosphatase family protein [Archangium sp.]|uniref:protein-tyrosine phosphatase family protein n=1 Tax=Archangium sp. TaxID=1872627 RepID=UPI002ED7D24D
MLDPFQATLRGWLGEDQVAFNGGLLMEGQSGMSRARARACRVDWLVPLLGLGRAFAPDAVPYLANTLKVRHVIDCRQEACDDAELLAGHGMSLLHLPTLDHQAIAEPLLREGVAWAVARLERGERVLIHCEHGVGRSALLALCVLVELGDAPLAAMERAKAARSAVCPNTAQLRAFLAWCEAWRGERGAGWELPSLVALEEAALGPLGQALRWPP